MKLATMMLTLAYYPAYSQRIINSRQEWTVSKSLLPLKTMAILHSCFILARIHQQRISVPQNLRLETGTNDCESSASAIRLVHLIFND